MTSPVNLAVIIHEPDTKKVLEEVSLFLLDANLEVFFEE